MLLSFKVSVVEQNERQIKVGVKDIAHGTRIPPWIFSTFVPTDGVVFDLGGADGVIQDRLDVDLCPVSFDINKDAVEEGRKRGRLIFCSDVTKPEYPLFFRQADAVLLKALLCNLAYEDENLNSYMVKSALLTARTYLNAGGVLIIADMLRMEEKNPAFDIVFPEKKDYQTYKRKWNMRYKRNREIGLPDGTFLVTGSHDQREWGSEKILRNLKDRGEFERLARHFGMEEIQKLIKESGFEVVFWGVTVCPSRSGKPLSQFVCVAKQCNFT